MDLEDEHNLDLEDEHLGIETEDEQLPQEVQYGTDTVTVHKVRNAEEVVDALACYAYEEQLLELASLMPPLHCTQKGCSSTLHKTTSKIGTAMLIKWVSSTYGVSL